MNVDPSRCANCGVDIRAEIANGLDRCTGCGGNFPLPLVNDEARRVRRHWRLCFWLCFLLTPAAVLLVALQPNWFKDAVPGSAGQFLRMMAPIGVVGTFAAGALGAGYCLAKLHAKPRTTAGLIGVTIAFAVGLTVVYVGILFVGCLILVERYKLFQF